MSKESLPQHTNNEEADLGLLFSAIGRLFDKLYRFILSIFKFIFDIIIFFSRAIIENVKTIIIVVAIAAALGYGLEKILPERYDSVMMVRTYFDARYQLQKNLNYYNAVIAEDNHAALTEIFGIDEDTLRHIIEFELTAAPETENQRILQYDNFIKSIDSVRAQELSFEDFIENRDILSGNLFEIHVEATKKDIFKDLDQGIFNSFENLYSIEKKKKRDSLISLRKQSILSSIAEIDSLQSVYISVLKEESSSTKATINLSQGFPLQQEKSVTNEYQLLNKEITLRDELNKLEDKKVQENEFFDVISSFQRVGNKVKGIKYKYSLTFPALAFILLSLGFLTKNYVRYVKNYEA